MQHTFLNYVHIPKMIGIRTNIPRFRWGFGVCNFPTQKDEFDHCKIKVFLEVRKDSQVFEDVDLAAYKESFRDFKAIPQAKTVVFNKKIGPVYLRFWVSIQGNQVNVVVGKSYLRLIKYKIMYIHPISYVLFDIVSLLLLQCNMTTIYGSATTLPSGSTVVCMAAPNTGKSITVLKLQNSFGARIIAEDMAVTNGESIWGAPNTGLYREYHDEALKMVWTPPQLDTFAQSIDAVFILQKGALDREMKTENFLHQLMLINRYSLGYYYSPCVRVLDYYNRDFDVMAAQTVEEQILCRMIGKARTAIIERQNSLDFAQYIHVFMSGEHLQGDN